MPADLNPSSKPQLSARPSVTWLETVLRVDQIRTDTLVQLVQHWADPDSRDDIITQLDALAEAVSSPREGELEELIEVVQDVAGMDSAEVRMHSGDAVRLHAELSNALVKVGRFGAVRPVPTQRDRGAA